MERWPLIPGLSNLRAVSLLGMEHCIGDIQPNRTFQWAQPVGWEMQLPQDSYWAGVLRRPYEIAGPLPWDTFNRKMAIRISRDGRRGELELGCPPSCLGLGDPVSGRLYYLSGDIAVWEKNLDLDCCAAGLLMVRWGKGVRFTDEFREAWGRLRDRAAQGLLVGAGASQRQERDPRARTPSPDASVRSSSTAWEVVEHSDVPGVLPEVLRPTTPTAASSAAAPSGSSAPTQGRMTSFLEAKAALGLVCEVCLQRRFGEPQPFEFEYCWYCGAQPSHHHGRCCPAWQPRERRQGSRVRQRGRDALGTSRHQSGSQ